MDERRKKILRETVIYNIITGLCIILISVKMVMPKYPTIGWMLNIGGIIFAIYALVRYFTKMQQSS
ncbi:hypothetical protein OXPF_06810 [Oxobacter pfennigii]|uniref:YrhK domain-containing protein n=2 Tax=Oxobacter pfennigii TaxID=36849 RepID=A0A0N8NTQ0_9CLOT|nr:hypothetical protein OXPF_06810 [Oxobacter pfennigii]